MLTYPDFNRLKTFYLAHKYKSLQKAADQLHVTRSAVSQHITNLEKELKTSLFIRTNKTLLPTTMGEVLFQTMEPFMRSLGETICSFDQGRQEPFGLLRIGAPVQLGSNDLVSILSEFKQQHPNVRFEIVFGIPTMLCELVCKNKLDFAIIDVGQVFEKLFPISVSPLLDETQILACSRKFYAKNINGDHSYSKLIKAPYISHVPQATELRLWFKYQFGKTPGDLDLPLVCENIVGIKNAILGGLGLGLIPSHLVEEQLDRKSLVKIPTPKRDYLNKIMLAQLPNRKATLTEKIFLKFLFQQIGLSRFPGCGQPEDRLERRSSV